ncbi:helix-turn-helix domain-containing protein [Actinomadura gamaensis]|uniref:Scr1 family TA system antitoxin-like transcriptional regulator n=1 Tax=Actinomadura gamaensis TaxID=1763541 RepID=A0ABV9U7N4_9ACTN
MPAKKSDPHLRTFGAKIKRFREEAGLSQSDLAKLVNVTRSYIALIEIGRTRCRKDFSERLGAALNRSQDVAEAWDDLVRSAKYPQYYVDFATKESTATMLRTYSSDIVDGLLQVESYARCILASEEDLMNRMKLQEILRRDPAPMACFLMDESVLHRQVGSPEIMNEQLRHLLEVSSWEKVYLQVVPLIYYRGVKGSFVIATQDDRDEAAYASSSFGGETSEEAGHLARVNEMFTLLQAQAKNVADTRNYIRNVLEEKWT